MSELRFNVENEREQQQRAAIELVKRVNDVVFDHRRTANIDIRTIDDPYIETSDWRKQELLRISGKSHMRGLAQFYQSLHPDVTSLAIHEGVHSALPFQDGPDHKDVMLLATTLILPGDQALQAVAITVRDEFVTTGSTIYMDESGRFNAEIDIKPRNDELLTEALRIVGRGPLGSVVALFSATAHPSQVAAHIDNLRPVVREHYNGLEAERFLLAVKDRYFAQLNAGSEARKIGTSIMSSQEMHEMIDILHDAETWA